MIKLLLQNLFSKHHAINTKTGRFIKTKTLAAVILLIAVIAKMFLKI